MELSHEAVELRLWADNDSASYKRTGPALELLAKKMLRAIIKGFRYMKAFRAETVAILAKSRNTDDAQSVEEGYDVALKAMTRDYTVGDSVIVPDLEVRAGLLDIPKDKIPPVGKIYDFTLAHQVNAELDASHWKPAK